MKFKPLALAALIAALTACAAPKTDREQAKALLDEAVSPYQKQDYAQALPYFVQAEQAGQMYLNGEGVAKDPSAAFGYFQKAAARGGITGQYWLGYCYENGVGTAKGITQALDWYRKSAARGDHISQPAIDALKRLNENP
ncbi:sel1 repeat family protein [Aggregatibacter actinomycetemcomitans]|uniref:tetratricopeptide repeat protein n=1 Tax=Aggregatibacter actinomycetemcomitans TaxID=714 RepID=UPI00197C1904|nr:tetratricopeptide repeat protein [Aggregatibacter actinomycetemcomitans]MBN6076383.1 sel1 repeat family protein [Aggregatibacter actinomycetemcomitans]